MNPHKTHPVREGSIPKNFYHVIGGELPWQQYRWWCFVGLNHDPDTYKVSALPIELKHHIPLRAVGCREYIWKKINANRWGLVEASVRLELTTFALQVRCSNHLSYKAMFPHLFVFPADRNIPAKNRYDFYSLILYAPPRTYRNGANSGNRTRTFCLEGRCSTIKLYRQKR